MQTKSFYLLFVDFFYIYKTWSDLCVGPFWTSPAHLNNSRDNTDNRDNFGHYNRDKKFSFSYIPNLFTICL